MALFIKLAFYSLWRFVLEKAYFTVHMSHMCFLMAYVTFWQILYCCWKLALWGNNFTHSLFIMYHTLVKVKDNLRKQQQLTSSGYQLYEQNRYRPGLITLAHAFIFLWLLVVCGYLWHVLRLQVHWDLCYNCANITWPLYLICIVQVNLNSSHEMITSWTVTFCKILLIYQPHLNVHLFCKSSITMLCAEWKFCNLQFNGLMQDSIKCCTINVVRYTIVQCASMLIY